MPHRTLRALSSLLLCLLPVTLKGQELTPRAYWPAPEGTQVLSLGAIATRGDTVPDTALPIDTTNSDIDTYAIGYLRTINLLGRSSNIIVELPYSRGHSRVKSGGFGSTGSHYNGIGDLSVTASINLLGAPSMDRTGFAELRSKPQPILGASLKVVAPTGRYDGDRLNNVGGNRWAAKAELGSILPVTPRWLLELEAGAWFFEDNDNYLGQTRENKPRYTVEAHLVHRFRAGFWASLEVTAYRGGRSTLAGRRLDDRQNDSKLGATLVYPVASNQAIKLSYANGSLKDRHKDFDVYSLSYQLVF